MAYIGMRKPIVGQVNSRVDGSAVTYLTPMVIGPAVSANVTFDTADNPDYGDDIIIDNDKGVNGYSITLETNDITKEARAACLGWELKTSGGSTEYEITDAPPPEVGLGYIRVKMFKGTKKYEGFFFHALQFTSGGENASTKQKQITWNHPTMTGTGLGVYNDASGKAKFFDWAEFATEAAALAWIYGKFGAQVPA